MTYGLAKAAVVTVVRGVPQWSLAAAAGSRRCVSCSRDSDQAVQRVGVARSELHTALSV